MTHGRIDVCMDDLVLRFCYNYQIAFSLWNVFSMLHAERLLNALGDSGGALINLPIGEERSTDLVTGLASFPYDAQGCTNASQPRAFTRLSEYLDWMTKATEVRRSF